MPFMFAKKNSLERLSPEDQILSTSATLHWQISNHEDVEKESWEVPIITDLEGI